MSLHLRHEVENSMIYKRPRRKAGCTPSWGGGGETKGGLCRRTNQQFSGVTPVPTPSELGFLSFPSTHSIYWVERGCLTIFMYACGSSLGRNRGSARLTDDDKKITRVFNTSRVMTPHPSESLALPRLPLPFRICQ